MARVFKCWSSGWPVACQLGVSWSPGVWQPAEGGQYADCPPRKVESLQLGGPSGVRRPSGNQPKSVFEQSGEPPDRRTKWCPQAKWRPAEVGDRTSQGFPRTGGPVSAGQVATSPKSVVDKIGEPPSGAPGQEDQVVSAGQVSTWRILCGSARVGRSEGRQRASVVKKKERKKTVQRRLDGMWGSEGRRCKQSRADGLLKGEGLTETVQGPFQVWSSRSRVEDRAQNLDAVAAGCTPQSRTCGEFS